MILAHLLPRSLLLALVALGVTSCGGPAPQRVPVGVSTQPARSAQNGDGGAAANESVESRASRLHRDAIVVDGHNDVPSVLYGSGLDLADPMPLAHTDLQRLKRSGITAEFFSIYVEGDLETKPSLRGGGALRRALDLIDVTYRQVEKYPADLLLATSTADIRRAKKEGRVAVLMGIEGGHAIENSLGALRELHRLGCRYMTLTHTNTNEWADSAGFAGPTPTRHHGLSPFGQQVVAEMQRIGMLVDVSHVADDTFWAVMKIAKAPVIASHSSMRALSGHRRNLDDDMLRALAKNGGVVMVNFWSMFLSSDFQTAMRGWSEKNKAQAAELRARYHEDPLGYRAARDKLRAEVGQLPKVPLSVLIDHLDHAVKIAGIDHVGLGSDFDGVDDLPEGIEGVQDMPKITEGLAARGYKDDEILKILGANFMRVFEAAERFAQQGGSLSGDGNRVRIDEPARRRE